MDEDLKGCPRLSTEAPQGKLQLTYSIVIRSATVTLFHHIEVVGVAVPTQRIAAVRVALRSLLDGNLGTPSVTATSAVVERDGDGVGGLVAADLADEQARLTTEKELITLHDVLHGDAAAGLDLHIRAIHGHRSSHSTSHFLGGTPP